jgi:hypothetical protein
MLADVVDLGSQGTMYFWRQQALLAMDYSLELRSQVALDLIMAVNSLRGEEQYLPMKRAALSLPRLGKEDFLSTMRNILKELAGKDYVLGAN